MGSRRGSDADEAARDAAADASTTRFTAAHRKIGKTVTAAVSLFLVGSLMLYYGVQALGEDRDRGVAMCTVGSIAFLPGSYATWHLFGAWRRWPGYSFEHCAAAARRCEPHDLAAPASAHTHPHPTASAVPSYDEN
jgi:hypothetical protein